MPSKALVGHTREAAGERTARGLRAGRDDLSEEEVPAVGRVVDAGGIPAAAPVLAGESHDGVERDRRDFRCKAVLKIRISPMLLVSTTNPLPAHRPWSGGSTLLDIGRVLSAVNRVQALHAGGAALCRVDPVTASAQRLAAHRRDRERRAVREQRRRARRQMNVPADSAWRARAKALDRLPGAQLVAPRGRRGGWRVERAGQQIAIDGAAGRGRAGEGRLQRTA